MSTILTPEVEYPDSDGKPMAENTLQFQWIVMIENNLESRYRDNDNVFVAGDLLWYPVEGNNKISQAPDTLVAFGRPKGYRGSYRQWEEGGIAPQVVFEILSPGNRKGEMDEKFAFYERYGVEEYYLYDPDRIRLQGWQRVEDELHEIAEMQGWVSPRLGIRFEMTAETLVLYHPDGRPFRPFSEIEHALRQAEAEREKEARARKRAEAKRRKAEQQREKETQARQQAEAERERAEHERDTEAKARQQAETEREKAEQERNTEAKARQQAEAEREKAEREKAAMEILLEKIHAQLRAMGDQTKAESPTEEQ